MNGTPIIMIGAVEAPNFEEHLKQGPYRAFDAAALLPYKNDPRLLRAPPPGTAHRDAGPAEGPKREPPGQRGSKISAVTALGNVQPAVRVAAALSGHGGRGWLPRGRWRSPAGESWRGGWRIDDERGVNRLREERNGSSRRSAIAVGTFERGGGGSDAASRTRTRKNAGGTRDVTAELNELRRAGEALDCGRQAQPVWGNPWLPRAGAIADAVPLHRFSRGDLRLEARADAGRGNGAAPPRPACRGRRRRCREAVSGPNQAPF